MRSQEAQDRGPHLGQFTWSLPNVQQPDTVRSDKGLSQAIANVGRTAGHRHQSTPMSLTTKGTAASALGKISFEPSYKMEYD